MFTKGQPPKKPSRVAVALAKIPSRPPSETGGMQPTLKRSKLFNKIAELKKDPIEQ